MDAYEENSMPAIVDTAGTGSPSNHGKDGLPRTSQAQEDNARQLYLRKTLDLSHDPFAFGVTEQELGGPPDAPYFFSYYVDPPALAPGGGSAISWLRESQRALVFGAPGTGKTALRLTLEAECRSTFGGPKTLVVTYLLGDDFATPLSPAEHWQRLAQALAIDLLIQVIEQFNPLIAVPTDEQIVALRQQSAVAGRRTQQLLTALATDPQAGLERFWPSLGRPAVRHIPSTPTLRNLLARVQAAPLEPPTSRGQDLLQEGLAVAHAWGFEQIFVLVDEVDARQREPAAMLALIQPLLDSLDDWEEVRLYFKFFLGAEMLPLFEPYATDEQISLLPQPVQAIIHWETGDLATLLLQRFTAAGAHLPGVDMLAGSGLTGRLNASLVQAAEGSPRRLLAVFSTLIDAHCRRDPTELLLDATDWEEMRGELESIYGWNIPPPLPSAPR
jgi:hypothetical protein